MSRQRPGGADAPELDEVRALLTRAAGGDPGRPAAAARPAGGGIPAWGRLGDLAAHVQLAWAERIGRSNSALRRCWSAGRGAAGRAAVGRGPRRGALMVERVVATWLEVHAADLDAAEPPDGRPVRSSWC